ncbi:hypothetical protein BLD25_02750 [Candidatus Gracilibacteria bacterium GN02-872]|nr:hypothetical protein BLD25_02750 [Candidatus Gracilibacteria bacterium GN02-872]RKW24781.1 MAG: hypothetical protein D8B46_00740 [Candidatus Gracilibacteria bacterium]
MKKYFVFLALLIFLSGCEQNIKKEINSEVNHLATQTGNIDKIEKEIFTIGNFDGFINFHLAEFKSWENTIKFIYQSEKSLLLVPKKESIHFLKDISVFDGENLIIELSDKNIFGEDFLNYFVGAKGNLFRIVFSFDLKEKDAVVNISLKESEILKKLDFKEKEIVAIKGNGFGTISCEKGVEKIIPKICNK